MVGIYFSGTGNTRHCVNKFLEQYGAQTTAIPIEDAAAAKALQQNDYIVFGYPIYYSSLPKIVDDFIKNNSTYLKGKSIFVIATMGLFSGDGAGCSARLFKKYGAEVTGGLHVKMPDCIGDVKLLKKTLEENRRIIELADIKIAEAAAALKSGNPPKQGLGVFYHIAGLFGQRLWFRNKTKEYSDILRIDGSKCTGCGTCAKICPMKNMSLADGKAQANGRCTLCYRCAGSCPRRAVTLLGSEVHEQCRFENYVTDAK